MLEPEITPTNMNDPNIARAAAQDKQIADSFYWSRYPLAMVTPVPGGIKVIIGYTRYGQRPDDGPFSVRTVVPGPGLGISQ